MNHDDDTCPHLVPANRQYHQALSANRKLLAENARLKAEVERLTLENSQYEEHHKYGQNVITSLREEVEQLTVARNYFIHKMMQKIKEVDRLTKAVMHSPAAQLKLKELEGKTTFDEINPDNQ